MQRELARRNLSGAPVQVGAVGRRRTGFHAEAEQARNDAAQHIAAPRLGKRRRSALVPVNFLTLRNRNDALRSLQADCHAVVVAVGRRNRAALAQDFRNLMFREPGHLAGMRRKNPVALPTGQKRRTARNQIQRVGIDHKRNLAAGKGLFDEGNSGLRLSEPRPDHHRLARSEQFFKPRKRKRQALIFRLARRFLLLGDRNAALPLREELSLGVFRRDRLCLQIVTFHDGLGQLDLQHRAVHLRRQNAHQPRAAPVGAECREIRCPRHALASRNAEQRAVSPFVGLPLSRRNSAEITLLQHQRVVCFLSHFIPPLSSRSSTATAIACVLVSLILTSGVRPPSAAQYAAAAPESRT